MSYTELLNEANNGSPSAKAELAKLCFYGRETEHSYERAFAYAKEAWDGGYAAASEILFQCYFYGFGTERNVQLAKEIAYKAASCGAYATPWAVFGLSGIEPPAYPEPLACLYKAAAANSEYGLEVLVRMYLLGYREYQDLQKAAEYIDKLYKINSPVAYAYDAYRYMHGKGVEKDEARGVELATKAYEAGVLYGYTVLANAKYYGKGTPEDKEGAVAIIREAERRGDANAAIRVYNLSRYGEPVPGKYARTQPDFEKPASVYRAAEWGNADCEYIVSTWLPKGEEQLMWQERAARHGNMTALKNMLSYYMESVQKDNVIEPRDIDKAIELCNIAIRFCNAEAYYHQSLNYSRINKPDEAKKYLKLGVEHGSGTCAFEYAKQTYYSFEVGTTMGNMKSGLTANEKAEAARLFIIALGKNIHGAYHYALNAFEFLPDTEKSNASKIIYDYFISITDVGRYTKNGDIYNYDNSIFGGKWELAAYLGSDKTLVIPEGIDVISRGAFCSHAPIENIVFPKSLKKISASVFSGMAYLRTVELQSAAEIGEDAFSGCKQLSEVKLSTGIIGHGAFMNCTSLKSVHIPEGTKTVLRDAFLDCTSLENVSLPESLDFAGACVFDGCDKLSMTEWGGVSYLACGNNPYAWAYKITSAPEKLTYHPDTKIITTMTSLEDKKYIFDNVKEIEFPKSVSCISYGCLNYRGVAKLTVPPREAISEDFISGEYSEIIISEGTKFVDRWSIKYTGKGSCHVWLPEGIKTVAISAFLGTGITVHAPEGKKLVKKIFTTTSKKNPNEIVYYTPGTPIGGTTGAIASSAAKEEPRPKVLLLDDGTAITSDGKILGKNGEVIEDSGKSKNTPKATSPKSGTGAQKSALGTKKPSTGAKNTAKAPSSSASDNQNSASTPKSPLGTNGTVSSNWDIPDSIVPKSKSAPEAKPKAPAAPKNPDFVIEDGTLVKYSGNDGYVQIPKGVLTIGGYAFDGRSDVYYVQIPEGVMFIDSRAFSGCTGLHTLKLPRTVEHISNDAFFGCRNLKVEVCKSTTCQKYAFRGLKLFAVKKYK